MSYPRDDIYPVIQYWEFGSAAPDIPDVPSWADSLVRVFERNRHEIDSRLVQRDSNTVLRVIGPDLAALGYEVERPGTKLTIRAAAGIRLDIDAWHPDERIVVEVEAVRAVLGNAFYRDFFRLLLMDPGTHGAIAVPLHGGQGGRVTRAYDYCERQMNALATSWTSFPFRGLLLIGY